MTSILLGVDGTGELDDAAYAHSMRHSFVNYIVRHSPAKLKRYTRGPAFDGTDMGLIISHAYTFVHLAKVANPAARILLTGYSRGGAAVVGVAARLAEDSVPVDAMLLFDPVNRSVSSETDEVTTNVRRLYQAWRMTNTYSRASFNNCAREWFPPTEGVRKYFWATHGGMGGVPWKAPPGVPENALVSEGSSELTLMDATYDYAGVRWRANDGDRRTQDEFLRDRRAVGDHSLVTYRQDADGARAVWQWAEPILRKEGFL